jgi:hypothetical protein
MAKDLDYSKSRQSPDRSIAHNTSSAGMSYPAVSQRQVAEEEDPAAQLVAQRQVPEEETAAQLMPEEEEKPAQLVAQRLTPEEEQPAQLKANNTNLPDNLKSGVENLSGVSMDDVKVHYNSDKPTQLQALAYAQGTDIHIASGQEKHLPHEAWHVAQQKQGRVQATMQMKEGVPVNDDPALETEADVMGAKAMNG